MNELSAYVTSVPSTTQVTLNIDSRFFTAFNPSPSFGPTRPQIVAIGDINGALPNSSGRVSLQTTISGSFQNISPQ
jgi:hypothetical protein